MTGVDRGTEGAVDFCTLLRAGAGPQVAGSFGEV